MQETDRKVEWIRILWYNTSTELMINAWRVFYEYTEAGNEAIDLKKIYGMGFKSIVRYSPG